MDERTGHTEPHEPAAKSRTTWLSTYQPSRSHGAPHVAPNLQSNKRYKLQDTTKCQHSKRYKKEAQKTPTCCRDNLKLWLRLSINSVCWTACLTEMRTAFPESSGINSDIKPSRLFTQCRTSVPSSHTASPFSGPSKQVLHGVYPFRPRRFSFQISRKFVSSSNANSHLRGHQIWAPNFQDLAHGTVARTYIILYIYIGATQLACNSPWLPWLPLTDKCDLRHGTTWQPHPHKVQSMSRANELMNANDS